MNRRDPSGFTEFNPDNTTVTARDVINVVCGPDCGPSAKTPETPEDTTELTRPAPFASDSPSHEPDSRATLYGRGIGEGIAKGTWELGKWVLWNGLTFGGYTAWGLHQKVVAALDNPDVARSGGQRSLDGVLDCVNALNPLYDFGRSGADLYMAAENDDAEAGGRALGELLVKIAAIFAIEKAAAELKPYGGPGGGHHVPAKAAFRGDPNYSINKALAISNAELDRLGVDHGAVSGAQQIGYRALDAAGDPISWDAIRKIETDALIAGNMNPRMASSTVDAAIGALQAAGVVPTRIPWGK